jgi:hypothetical protein
LAAAPAAGVLGGEGILGGLSAGEILGALGRAAGLVGAFATVLTLPGQPKAPPTVRHYTTAANALLIRTSGELRVGPDGKGLVYFTSDLYVSGEFAQQKLSLERTPVGFFEIPTSQIPGLQYRGAVSPHYGQPGGATEYTAPGPIPIGEAQFILIGP